MNNSYLRLVGFLPIVVLALSACEKSLNAPEVGWAFQVTAGACGHLLFAEKLGPDSASAVEAVAERKTEV